MNKNEMIDCCIEFIRLSITDRNCCISHLDKEDWELLFDYCKRQAVIGIGFTTVEKLYKQDVRCPKDLMMRWMSLAMQIEQRNGRMNAACKDVSTMFIRDGFDCCVLKGQGNMLNYPEHLSYRRQSGDIDLWVHPQNARNPIKTAISYVYKHSKPKKGAIYHHIDMPMQNGIELEVHFRPSFCRSFIRNRRMQRWFSIHSEICMRNKTTLGFSVPTPSVNVIYQMCHIFSHYFHEGIGLRQMIDYYFALKTWHNDCMEKKDFQSQGMWMEGLGTPVMSKEEVMHTLKSFGMGKFAAAVMWVLQTAFAMPDNWLICPPDEKRGKELLDEIMLAGNFGQYDERGKDMKNGGMIKHGLWKLKRVMRLVSSYPEEALWEPFFRVWHLGWRGFH